MLTGAKPKKMLGAQPRTGPGWFLGGEFEGAKRSRTEGKAQTGGEAREEAGRGLGRGLGKPLPRIFFKIITWNRAIWCIADAKIEGYKQITFLRFEEHILHARTDLYDLSTVEYEFWHTQSSCNHCVSNITRRSRIFFDVSRCTIYMAVVLGNTTACKRYPLCQHPQKFSPR